MKKIYLLAAMIWSGFAFGQSYIPIPEANAVWIQAKFLYSAYNGHEHATVTEPLHFGADSIIGGETYHSLRGHGFGDWIDGWGNPSLYQEGSDTIPTQVHVLFRQDVAAKKIYAWDMFNNVEGVLYDFDALSVGSPYPPTINNWNYPQIKVMAYDSLMLADGLYHERWILGSDASDSGFVSIIEGVGSTMGFNLPISIPFEQSSGTMCMSINDNLVYDGWANANGLIAPRYSSDCKANLKVENMDSIRREVKIYPNPSSDQVVIVSEIEFSEVVVRDLQGRSVITRIFENMHDTCIDITHLRPGKYILSLLDRNGQIINRTIIRM